MEKHTTITGEIIEYETPAPELAAFLARVVDAANDPRVTESEITGLVYGKDNPLLDQTIFPHHGAVTKAAFANPVYHIMLDLLGRKRVQAGTLDMEAAGAAATVTVTEAAAELGVSTSAIRQAIHAHRIPAVKRGDTYLLDPRDVRTFRVTRRGPKPRSQPDLQLVIGNEPGGSFRIKIDGFEELERKGRIVTGIVREFRGRGAFIFGGKESNRMVIVERAGPGDPEDAFEIGSFRIWGKYRVVEKINNPRTAAERWKAFEPG